MLLKMPCKNVIEIMRQAQHYGNNDEQNIYELQ